MTRSVLKDQLFYFLYYTFKGIFITSNLAITLGFFFSNVFDVIRLSGSNFVGWKILFILYMRKKKFLLVKEDVRWHLSILFGKLKDEFDL